MARKAAKTKRPVRRHHTKTRSSVKSRALYDRRIPEQIGKAAGRIAENVVTELVRPVVPDSGIPLPHAEAGNRSVLLDATARITGGALALSSTLITAPIMFVLQAFMSLTGIDKDGDDLTAREYRDEAGRIHHHTRTFMRDHGDELSTLAA